MNATMTSKNTMRVFVTILALTMTPALAWAQYNKIYIPPKVYTPPKVSIPRPASRPKISTPKQPKVKQSQAKQPKQKSRGKVAKEKVQKTDRRQQNQDVKRERNQQKQQRQAQQHQQKLQQNELKQQRKQQKEQEKAQRKQEKSGKSQVKQDKQKNSSPQPAARSGQTEPQGRVTPLRAGGHAIDTPSGNHYEFNREGKLSGFSKGGTEATFRRDGSFKTVKANGMQIEHGAAGVRTVQSPLPGGGRLASTGPGRGFIETPMTRGGHAYVMRTYVAGGRVSVAVYRPYFYRGVVYYRYMPGFFFAPRFYAWAYYPWPTPIVFSWGWFGAPWYGFYGPYFAPFAAYPNASLWLTDYLLAANLQAAYQDRDGAGTGDEGTSEADTGNDSGSPLTPEVKYAIASEVRAQIAANQTMAAHPDQAETAGDEAATAVLDPTSRVFVVSSSLSEQTASGGECGLTPGDVIGRLGDSPDAEQRILVTVLSSKRGDCAVGSQLQAPVQELVEMHNDFLRQLDSGLGALAQDEGQNGLPVGPAAGQHLAPSSQPETPDASAPTLLQQQQESADQAESEIRKTVQSGSSD